MSEILESPVNKYIQYSPNFLSNILVLSDGRTVPDRIPEQIRQTISRMPGEEIALWAKYFPIDAARIILDLQRKLDEAQHIIDLYEKGLNEIEKECDEQIRVGNGAGG